MNRRYDFNPKEFARKLNNLFSKTDENQIKKGLTKLWDEEDILHNEEKQKILFQQGTAYRLLAETNRIAAADKNVIQTALAILPANKRYIPTISTSEDCTQDSSDSSKKISEEESSSDNTNSPAPEAPIDDKETTTQELPPENEKTDTNNSTETNNQSKETLSSSQITCDEIKSLTTLMNENNRKTAKIVRMLSAGELFQKEGSPRVKREKENIESESLSNIESLLKKHSDYQKKLDEFYIHIQNNVKICQETCAKVSEMEEMLSSIRLLWETDVNTRIESIDKTTTKRFDEIFEEMSTNYRSLFNTNREKIDKRLDILLSKPVAQFETIKKRLEYALLALYFLIGLLIVVLVMSFDF